MRTFLENNTKKSLSLEDELMKAIYIESFYEFFKDAWKVLLPTEVYIDNWHIKYLCDRLQKETYRIWKKEPKTKDLIINIPFRSTKSLLVTVCWPAWSWMVFNELKIIATSYSGDLAIEHAVMSRNLITSQWFNKFSSYLDIRKDENSKSMFVNKRGGFRKSVGIGGQITGSGADIIIVDDPLKPMSAESKQERENANNFYDQTLYSRLNNPNLGVRVIVMQRLHEKDLSGHLLSNHPDLYEHICIPGEIITPGYEELVKPVELKKFYKRGLFFPKRFSSKHLSVYKRSLGSYGYSGQIGQKPTPPGGGIIKKHWFNIVSASTLTRDLLNEPIHFHADTSYTEKSENDPNAFLSCFVRNNCLYIINCHDIHLEFPELCAYTIKYVNNNGYTDASKVYIEPKASGKSVVQQLKSTTSLNVIEAENPDGDKLVRLNAISPIVESRRIYLVDGAWVGPFLDQVTNQPNSSLWDMTDVFTQAVKEHLTKEDFDFMFF